MGKILKNRRKSDNTSKITTKNTKKTPIIKKTRSKSTSNNRLALKNTKKKGIINTKTSKSTNKNRANSIKRRPNNPNNIISAVESTVKNTIKKYNLIKKSDKILVACSGGKDSTAILHILNKLGYKIEAITVDALIGNYTKKNLENIKKVCKQNKIKLHIISFRKEFGYSLCYLKSLLNQKGANLKSCTICGVLRRYLINKYARKLKATKLVTGHNLTDEAQTVIMNLLKNNIDLLARQGPITRANKDKKFVQRIKPLYFVSEKDVKTYSKIMKFPVNYEPCPCRVGVYRNLIRTKLDKLEKTQPGTHKKIISWFLKTSPKLKIESQEKQNYCNNCKEPSKTEFCMTCKILKKIK